MMSDSAEIIISNARVRLATNLNEANNKTAVEIRMTEHVIRLYQAFSMSFPTVEVAAALVGPNPVRQKNGKYLVIINDLLPGKHLRSGRSSVVLSADTFAYWNTQLAKRYRHQSAWILGWGHTHPRLPIFMSRDDVVVHQAAFRNEFNVALVSDPFQPMSAAKFFAWSTDQNSVCDVRYVWPAWIDEFGSIANNGVKA